MDPGAPGFVFGGASPGLNESGTCAAMPAEPDPHPSILASQNIPLMLCGLVLFVVSSVLMMGNKFEGYCRELREVEESRVGVEASPSLGIPPTVALVRVCSSPSSLMIVDPTGAITILWLWERTIRLRL